VVVHDHGDDGQLVARHGVEFGDGEADGAISNQRQHCTLWMRDLRADGKSEAHADCAEKTVRDVTAWLILANNFVEPVIGLCAVADDDRIVRNIFDDCGNGLIWMNRRSGAMKFGLEALAALDFRVAYSLVPRRAIGPFARFRGSVHGAEGFARIGGDAERHRAHFADFLGIDFDVDNFRGQRDFEVAHTKSEQAEAHADG
jgi:hypothetical protein